MKKYFPIRLLAGMAVVLAAASAHADEGLNIKIQDAAFAKIASARAFHSGSDLLVAGTVRRSTHYALPVNAHVDVRVLGANNAVLAERCDDIDVPSSRRRGAHAKSATFVTRFEPGVAADARTVCIILHGESHL